MGSYEVRLREAGSRRHMKLGRHALTDKRVHALRFETVEDAREAASWMVTNNPGAFDSAQVCDSNGVVERVA